MKKRVRVMRNFVAACVALCGVAGRGCSDTQEAKKEVLAEHATPAAGQKKLAVDLGGGVKMEMTLIPAGEFQMGNAESAQATAEFFNKYFNIGSRGP